MDTLAWTFDRLFEWAVVSSILLVLGSLAALCCRQPIRRMRVIEFTLASCLVAPLVSLAPGLPRWTLPWMSAVETAPAHARLKTASVGGAASPRNANGPQTEPVLSSRHSGDADLDPQTSVADLASDLAIGPLDLSATDMPPIELAETDDVQLTSDASADVRSDAPSATFSDTLPKAPPDAPTANPAIGARSDDQPATAVESPPIAPLSIDDEPDPPRVSAQSMTTVDWTAMNLPFWVVSGYAVGLILLTSWLLIGLAGLRRVLRTCRAAPEWCRRLLEEIAGPAGARVRLLVSPRAPQPFTFAWRPATIVLPEALLNSRTAVREEDSGSMARASPSALRLALAHEWSHVTRGDVWSWSLAGLVRLLFFYQPLCWWLRGQLRLCQDFLADSDAAREATPATYAEFLASRAAGRPLAIGLGIAGGKSDLYRRITMLLQIQKPLETRCSKSWTIAVATVVVGAILLTGTFGERPAALGEMDAVGDSEPTIVKKPADQEKPTKRSPTEAESRPTTQEASERQVIVDRMLSRQYKADSARIEYRRTVERGGDIIQQGDSILTVAPNGWLLQQPIGNGSQQVTLVQEGRCFQFQSWEESAAAAGGGGGAAAAMMSQMTGRMAGMRGGVSVGGVGVPAGGAPGGMAGDAPRGPRGRARNPNAMAGGAPAGIPGGMPGGMPGGPGGMPRGMPGAAFSGWGSGSVPLEVTYPEAVPAYADAWIPFGFGTLYYKSGCEFVRRHAAAMRLGELQEVNGIQARLLEWDVPPAEAAQAFPIVNQFLSLGAVLRLFIDEKREGAVIRIEGIDPFDTLQFQVDFSDFAFIDKKLSPLPQKARIVSGDTVETIELLRAEGINKTIKPETFTLHIAAGTVVSDARLKRTDKIDPEQKTLNRDGQTYPLRSFTTTVPYPNGFPVKLLKELDRETLPWEEARKAMHWGAGDHGGGGAPGMGIGAAPGMGGSPNSGASSRMGMSVGAATASGTDGQPAKASAEGKPSKREVVYGGKDFAYWKDQLLSDVEPETQIKALKALGAFAGSGYGKEVAEAIDQALPGDVGKGEEFLTVNAALQALKRCGPDALPMFERLVKSENEQVFDAAEDALINLGREDNWAVPLMLDSARRRRGRYGDMYHKLGRDFLHEPAVLKAITDLMDDEIAGGSSIQTTTLLNALSECIAEPKVTAPLLLKACSLPDAEMRDYAARILARRGPVSNEAIEAIKGQMLDSFDRQRWSLVLNLSFQSEALPELALPALIAALEDNALYESTVADRLPETIVRVIGSFGPAASSAVPVLIKSLKGELPRNDPQLQSSVASALKKIGPDAAEALPILKQLMASPPPEQDAATWRHTFSTAIKRIEGK